MEKEKTLAQELEEQENRTPPNNKENLKPFKDVKSVFNKEETNDSKE